MARIAVFDSGLGSLSIIKALQKTCKMEIIYFADQKNFPYGEKSKRNLTKIIRNSIKILSDKFNPDLIVVGSNTPTMVLEIENDKIVGVNPPIKEAVRLSKNKIIGILATKALVNSKGLSNYIIKCKIPKEVLIHKINASNLIQLVESGKFLSDKNYSRQIIKNSLKKIFSEKKIDVVTLSSTHLSFLKQILELEFPDICFIDPSDKVAIQICKKIKSDQKKNIMKIFSSDQTGTFQKNLMRMGIKKKIEFLSI